MLNPIFVSSSPGRSGFHQWVPDTHSNPLLFQPPHPLQQGVAHPWGKVILDVLLLAVTVPLVYSWSWQSFWNPIPHPGVHQTGASGPAWH